MSSDPTKRKVVRYMPQEDLKEKYRRPRTDRIRTYCKSIKSIGSATNLQITVEEKPNGTVHITVTAHPQSPHELDKAVRYIIGEFIKAECQATYGVKGINGPRKANNVIDEGKQEEIQKEGGHCPPLSREALKKHDLLTSCELRQFRCPKCLSPFWRTVLIHKPVAHCKQCKTCLLPLKREEEYGIGRFICECGNTFYGRCQATDVRQCKDCRKDVKDPYIHPKFRAPYGPLPPGLRKPPVVKTYKQKSKEHTCTGSTISSFVRQWDEVTRTESVEVDSDEDEGDTPRMPTEDFEKQCGSDDGCDSDSECGSQAPDRRRPQYHSQAEGHNVNNLNTVAEDGDSPDESQ